MIIVKAKQGGHAGGNRRNKYEIEVYSEAWHQAHPEFGPLNHRYTDDDGQVVEVDPLDIITYDHSGDGNFISAVQWIIGLELGMRKSRFIIDGWTDRLNKLAQIKHPHSRAWDEIR